MTFKVYAWQGVIFAATILVEQLKKLGHDAILVSLIKPDDESTYIIYCAQNIGRLPKNYIVYQTESQDSKWFTKKYLDIIQGAICVWEYSEMNIQAYRHLNKEVSIVSPGISPQPFQDKDIPVLFYGYIQGGRRWNVLHRTQKDLINSTRFSALIKTNCYGKEISDLLRRAKVVLNIHFYENASIESFRVNEALSYGCHVVSERGISGDEKYNGLVHFSDSDKLAEECLKLSNAPFDYDLSELDNLQEIKSAVEGLTLPSSSSPRPV